MEKLDNYTRVATKMEKAISWSIMIFGNKGHNIGLHGLWTNCWLTRKYLDIVVIVVTNAAKRQIIISSIFLFK